MTTDNIISEKLKNASIAIIGLGYVGLPLSVEFGKKYKTIGFDLDPKRIKELLREVDSTREISQEALRESCHLTFSDSIEKIKQSNIYIVTVPTPIDNHRQPDLNPLRYASRLLGGVIKKGDTVIYESTVYPGATEETCIPLLEEASGLSVNKDFDVGYSPERINPGDRDRPLTKIKKVTSGSSQVASDFVDELYKSIITAGTFKASSIKVAEASKIIENTQRDVNIALINELAIIFSHLGIDTKDVLDAASTKWNFIKLTPGLVGGHCISVDPYYLLHKSISAGYIPDIIRKSREINDSMAKFISSKIIKKMIQRDMSVKGAKALCLGVTFKENCSDTRNTKSLELIEEISSYGIKIDIYDPWIGHKEASNLHKKNLINNPQKSHYDLVLITVAHREFIAMGDEILSFGNLGALYFDMKNILEVKRDDILRL
ncbi:nucleotide sugar dehydrogenase [Chromohalobacter israelensis]|uniref:nucleotide sugar dehydrogenase n=1 Tax=Chromohalobacter israelensis TaxID=141390 RepID=UPI001CC6F7CF|nr:nucleotide sugar dehydrogenase [Chromohalobacter salexigens]MBZ5877010.1 nucleotide sugar dehydrogenase [Chromohalobacter salexigens]